ncbi:MAG: PIG-L family deacetylase [Solobacterium sp.]|nr:PIG-L family deacetylase [Solobacterium sp.]
MITKTALKIAAPYPQIESFDSYLFIGPHPDDIEIGAGATAAKLADMGKKVVFAVCTDGRYGTDHCDMDPETLVRVRREESLKSAEVLGVKDVRFLGLSDGGFYRREQMLSGLARVISDVQPDMIFVTDPDVTSECHADHLNAGRCAKQIACISHNPGIMEQLGARQADVKAIGFYMTAKPNRFVKTSGYIEKQFSSVFDCHLSQYPKGCADADTLKLYLRLRAAEFGIRSLKLQAEGFRVLGRIHMHCLSEAGS